MGNLDRRSLGLYVKMGNLADEAMNIELILAGCLLSPYPDRVGKLSST
jgi:hypothetical protein